jgi:DNA-binding transcriptional regulator YdaS (Cro superfamily)
VALRHGGSITAAAELLGMSNVSLSEWIGRRRIPAK